MKVRVSRPIFRDQQVLYNTPETLDGAEFTCVDLPAAAASVELGCSVVQLSTGRNIKMIPSTGLGQRRKPNSYKRKTGTLSVTTNGSPVKLEEVICRNMETGDGSAAGGAGDQFNKDAVPLFTKANHMLFGEIAGMFKTLVLSASLTAMDGQAFIGADAEYVIIPGAVTRIADDAFEGSRVRMLFGNTDAVRKYADDHGLIVIQTNLQ